MAIYLPTLKAFLLQRYRITGKLNRPETSGNHKSEVFSIASPARTCLTFEYTKLASYLMLYLSAIAYKQQAF